MDVADFDFALPDELIAQAPPPVRGDSRLLVLHRESGRLEHARFGELDRYLRTGDLLVLNDTRVFPARLLGRREPSGGAVECLLLERVQRHTGNGARHETDPAAVSRWRALVHPGQKLKPGARVLFEAEGLRLYGEVLSWHFHGLREIRLWTEGALSVDAAIDRIGHIPLPPYIKRDDLPSDRDRYQTVYASESGSVAAPTAGLHFTAEQLEALRARGIERTDITLHVGYGTFKPVRAQRVEDHVVDPEVYSVGLPAATALTRARQEGRRVIAVGTSTTRALESLGIREDGTVEPAHGQTNLFIRPGHRFQLVSGLITNFHLPRSSLLLLVAAFAGWEQVQTAYREAVKQCYRFYSYGDAMLIL
jgi:S-adenosylmethionine:tRNA ribosyltransferase-isomerase